jgi:hypothetical protein
MHFFFKSTCVHVGIGSSPSFLGMCRTSGFYFIPSCPLRIMRLKRAQWTNITCEPWETSSNVLKKKALSST